MQASDVLDGVGFQLRVEAGGVEPDEVANFLDVRVRLTGTAEDPTLLRGTASLDVRPYNQKATRQIEGIFGAEVPTLCTVVATSPASAGTLIHLEGRKFDRRFRLPETIDFAVDEKIVDSYRNFMNDPTIEVEDVLQELRNDLVVEAQDADQRAVIISAGPDVEELPGGFRVHGVRFVAFVKRGPDERYLIDRLVRREALPNLDQSPHHLLSGSIELRDQRVASRSTLDIQDVASSSDSYIQLWRQYNEISSARSLRRARKFGYFKYEDTRQLPDKSWEFILRCSASDFEDLLQGLGDLDQVSMTASREVPTPIAHKDSTDGLQEWLDDRLHSREDTVFTGIPNQRKHRRTHQGLVLRPAGRSRRDEVNPADSGYLYLSLVGNQVALRRRKRAAERIESGQTPLRQLGLLLEKEDVPAARRRGIRALTRSASEKFGGTPNQKQEEALNIALNTPDIAVIQGPPGTGKTRLISAVQTRLSEEAEEAGDVSGQILLTSYQHTAVDNVADASSVYGLPAVRIGGKGQRDERLGDHTDRWRQTVINRLDQTIAESSYSEPPGIALREVSRKLATYQIDPGSITETIDLLEEVEERARPHVSGSVLETLREKRRDLQLTVTRHASDTDPATLLSRIRALRTESETFQDDGPQTAEELLFGSLSRLSLSDEDEELLERAADWVSDDPPPFLDELKGLKDQLIDQVLRERRDTRKDLRNSDVESILQAIVSELHDAAETTSDGAIIAARNFQHALENEPSAIREAVATYSAVLASTCSQADSGLLKEAKGLDYGEVPHFETVVVDEAARSNPLDLFIPLSMAERRIVLVGDQNQLPHMLEPGVQDELSEEVSDDEEETLRQSLFERLYEYALDLEEKDGVRRCVRLNEQYRMHPILGDYVGDNFYADDESGGLDSPLGAEEYQHDLARHEGKVAAWVDVPHSEGGEIRGKSKSRPVEARQVAKELKMLLRQDQEERYSFGVITFYRAQLERINEALVDANISEETEEGYRVRDEWRRYEKEDGSVENRIEVGTVDAFQGKEFDVVLLSTTRSCASPPESEQQAYRKYGHIMRPNRLCVAMSRQKRLLVVVGDAGTATTEAAEKHISALYNFHQLCTTDAGHVQSL